MLNGADGGISGTGSTDSTLSVPVPVTMPNPNSPPPFLCKTYDMVDDPSTDAVVSWSSGNNSFVIWNPPEFGRDLLPKYFKHNNFSSFVRQLNTYGFRKVHPDRWEFANEGFLRGQKHLLKTIKRRKASHGPILPQLEQSQVQNTVANACVEVGKLSLEEDVEMLKREKNVLMQELVKLRQKQQTTDKQLQVAMDRLQVMDQRHQQLMSFLAKAVQSPGFLTQFVQQQAQNNRRISEANKKRRLKQDDVSVDDYSSDPGGQIVKYQPSFNEASTAFLRQMMEMDNFSQLEFRNNDQDNFLFGDASSSSNGQHVESSLNGEVKPSIPEVQASSAQFLTPPASIIPPCGSSSDSEVLPPSSVGTGSDMGTMVRDSHISSLVDKYDTSLSIFPDMVPESTVKNNSTQFVPSTFGLDTELTFNFENISPGDETADISAYEDVWKLLNEEIDSAQLDDLVNGSEMLLMNGESDNSQNVDHLTDQMGLLSSGANKKDFI